MAEGIEEARGVAKEIVDFLSETLQVENQDMIFLVNIVGAAVDTIKEFTRFATDLLVTGC